MGNLDWAVTPSASFPVPRLRAGDRIDSYELLHPIAQGGMGAVWAARLHGAQGGERIVAIKTALPALASDARVRAMFLNEARLASAVSHRNVARILDFLECEGALFLVMEWVQGPSLKQLQDAVAARGEQIPSGVLLRVAADVCAGLHAAHELRDASGGPSRLVHRDVSPHNIVVSVEGAAKLIDFGVAKARDCAAQETTFGALKGKPHFMAPEQARADDVDRRADVWSVGAVIFYLLEGHAPFETNARSDTLRRLLAGMPARSLPGDVDPAIARIVDGCLAQRREDRFQTAAAVGEAIEAVIEDLGLAASAADVAAFVAGHARDHLVETERRLRLDAEPSATWSYPNADDGRAPPRLALRAPSRTAIVFVTSLLVVGAATYAATRSDDASTLSAEGARIAPTKAADPAEPSAPPAAVPRGEALAAEPMLGATPTPAAPAVAPPSAAPVFVAPPPSAPVAPAARATRAHPRTVRAAPKAPSARPNPTSQPPTPPGSDGFGSAVETRK